MEAIYPFIRIIVITAGGLLAAWLVWRSWVKQEAEHAVIKRETDRRIASMQPEQTPDSNCQPRLSMHFEELDKIFDGQHSLSDSPDTLRHIFKDLNERKAKANFQDRLSEYLEKPEVQRLILNGYKGSCGLGVGLESEGCDALAILLDVETPDVTFPSDLEFDGVKVPIVVNPNWTVPVPQETQSVVESVQNVQIGADEKTTPVEVAPCVEPAPQPALLYKRKAIAKLHSKQHPLTPKFGEGD